MSAFDTSAFQDLVVVVGNTTWEVMQAKKAVKVEWEPSPEVSSEVNFFGNNKDVRFPAGLENTKAHREAMTKQSGIKQNVVRKDGNPEAMFKKAAKVIERSYSCPFFGTQLYGTHEFLCRCHRR